MAEEPVATADPTTPEPAKPEPAPKEDAPLGDSGEKALDAFKTRARDAEKRAKEAEARVAEFEEKDKTVTEKLTGKVQTLTSESEAAKAENLRLRVAVAKKLPTELIDRLKGNTQEELEADADSLLALVKDQKPSTSFDGGTRDPAPDPKTPDQAHNEVLMGLFGRPKNQ